jgi:large subunit ribosomal protein L5
MTSDNKSTLSHIVINVGLKSQDSDPKMLTYIMEQLSLIAGQKSVLVKSKKAISNFKLRKDVPIGCIVTLRKSKMQNFLLKFVNIALPRVRDFRGLPSNSFNMSNHYSVGIKDHTIFPEIELDKVTRPFGMNICFVIKSKTCESSIKLLKSFNLPIK